MFKKIKFILKIILVCIVCFSIDTPPLNSSQPPSAPPPLNPIQPEVKKPDLVVEKILIEQGVGKNNIVKDQNTTITVRYKNIGTSAPPQPGFIIKVDFGQTGGAFEFENGGTPISVTGEYYPFNPGGELREDYIGKFKKIGTVNLTATIDSTDTVDELNEDNNTLTKEILVEEEVTYPDFIVKDIIVTPDNPRVDEPVLIETIYQNIGDKYWRGLTYDFITETNFGEKKGLFEYDEYFNIITSNPYPSETPFESGDTFSQKIKGYYNKAGQIILSARVNPNERIYESNINNNELSKKIVIKNEDPKRLPLRLKGYIMLQVEKNGEAWYINPKTTEKMFLGRPKEAFDIMRGEGIGITNDNLAKIPVGLTNLSGIDTDNDGLSDLLEDSIGTDKENSDTDKDGYSDKAELENNYNPNGPGKINIDNDFTAEQKGKIFLQVESHGEAWYVNPRDGMRHYLGRPVDAFNIMRNLGLGISNKDFDKLI